MNTLQIIKSAQENADRAAAQGARGVRLPVVSFEDWRNFHGRKDDLSAREAHRAEQKRNYYFKRFLEAKGIGVAMVTCRADPVREWAVENDHPMQSQGERLHVLAHYVNQPDLPPAQCIHKRPLTADMAGSGLELNATLTTYGESPDAPEILSTVVHTRDGGVLESLEVLGVEHSPQEAFDLAMDLMSRHGVRNAFQDPQVRRPEFCPDCNELLVHTASAREYSRIQP